MLAAVSAGRLAVLLIAFAAVNQITPVKIHLLAPAISNISHQRR